MKMRYWDNWWTLLHAASFPMILATRLSEKLRLFWILLIQLGESQTNRERVSYEQTVHQQFTHVTPGCPIVSSNNSLTEPLSKYIDDQIRSLVTELPSYIRATSDLINQWPYHLSTRCDWEWSNTSNYECCVTLDQHSPQQWSDIN